MTEYLMMTLEDEDALASQSPKAMSELIERRADFADELRRAGRLKDCGRLRPSKEGKRIRREGDRLEIRDGPFTDEGRALGSYHWVEAGSVDEATELAEHLPILPADALDVRPLMTGTVPDDKEARPGKLFACAVLGSTATEQAWVKEVIGGLVLMRMTSLDE